MNRQFTYLRISGIVVQSKDCSPDKLTNVISAPTDNKYLTTSISLVDAASCSAVVNVSQLYIIKRYIPYISIMYYTNLDIYISSIFY